MTDNMSQISTWARNSISARRPGRRVGVAAVAIAAAVVLAGCGSTADGPASVPTRIPATPVAGAPTTTPAIGTVVPAPADIAAVRIDATGKTLVVQSTGKLATYSLESAALGNLDAPLLTVDLPVGAGPLALTAEGTALVPSPGGLTIVGLADGATKTVEIDGAALSAAQTTDGRYAVGTDKGSVAILDGSFNLERTVTGFVSVDSLAAANGVLVALDTHQTSVTEINPDDGKLSGALRVGVGATGIVADHYGRVIAADTDGNQIVVFSVDPLLNRQMGPVGKSPYGLADDVARNLVWVTLTATNEVAAFDLSSGAPEEKFRLPTIADPMSVAVDEQTGDLYIGSGTGGGLQRIAASEVK